MSTSSLPLSSRASISKSKRASTSVSPITVTQIPSCNPSPETARDHWVGGNPPTSFTNPWPSFTPLTFMDAFRTRMGSHPEKNFVPVPAPSADGTRSTELVRVRKPDWGASQTSGPSSNKLRATWIGHSSWFIETPSRSSRSDNDGSGESNIRDPPTRGIRLLLDPVFAERTSPFSFLGPKRYTPTPCSISDLPPVDLVLISHNHYDHLDINAVKDIYKLRGPGRVKYLVPRGNAAWFRDNVCNASDVIELDWWEGLEIGVEGVEGQVRVTCTPCQHASSRTGRDAWKSLWCSWVVETLKSETGAGANGKNHGQKSVTKKVYFAGDTGYQAVKTPSPCPAFKQIGSVFGPFDLGLLPIGLFKPQELSGGVHCSPEQALQIHKDVKAKLSVGMHYGTVRGGLSSAFEDVREPPRRFREAAEKDGCWLGGGVEGNGSAIDLDSGKVGVGLCDIGETVAV